MPTKQTSINSSTTNQANKHQGTKLEGVVSLFTGLDTTPGSGCGLLFKGDVHSDVWIIEVKSTRKSKLVFDTTWWIKLTQQAKQKHKPYRGLVFGWTDRPKGYAGDLQFGCLPEDTSLGVPDYVLVCKSKTKIIPFTYLDKISEKGISLLFEDHRVRLLPINTFNTYVQNNSN